MKSMEKFNLKNGFNQAGCDQECPTLKYNEQIKN